MWWKLRGKILEEVSLWSAKKGRAERLWGLRPQRDSQAAGQGSELPHLSRSLAKAPSEAPSNLCCSVKPKDCHMESYRESPLCCKDRLCACAGLVQVFMDPAEEAEKFSWWSSVKKALLMSRSSPRKATPGQLPMDEFLSSGKSRTDKNHGQTPPRSSSSLTHTPLPPVQLRLLQGAPQAWTFSNSVSS